jgi:hypothetical protein
MAKMNLIVQARLTAAQMRKLNPALKEKGLTLQEAVQRGLKGRIPAMYLDLTTFLAAMAGVGMEVK